MNKLKKYFKNNVIFKLQIIRTSNISYLITHDIFNNFIILNKTKLKNNIDILNYFFPNSFALKNNSFNYSINFLDETINFTYIKNNNELIYIPRTITYNFIIDI